MLQMLSVSAPTFMGSYQKKREHPIRRAPEDIDVNTCGWIDPDFDRIDLNDISRIIDRRGYL